MGHAPVHLFVRPKKHAISSTISWRNTKPSRFHFRLGISRRTKSSYWNYISQLSSLNPMKPSFLLIFGSFQSRTEEPAQLPVGFGGFQVNTCRWPWPWPRCRVPCRKPCKSLIRAPKTWTQSRIRRTWQGTGEAVVWYMYIYIFDMIFQVVDFFWKGFVMTLLYKSGSSNPFPLILGTPRSPWVSRGYIHVFYGSQPFMMIYLFKMVISSLPEATVVISSLIEIEISLFPPPGRQPWGVCWHTSAALCRKPSEDLMGDPASGWWIQWMVGQPAISTLW